MSKTKRENLDRIARETAGFVEREVWAYSADMGMAHTARGDRLIKNHLWSIMRLLQAMEKRHA